MPNKPITSIPTRIRDSQTGGAADVIEADRNWRADAGLRSEGAWTLTRLSAIAVLLSVMHNLVAVQVSLVLIVLHLAWQKRSVVTALALARPDRLEPARGRDLLSRPRDRDLVRARAVVEAQGIGEAHLVAMGDKQLLWSRDGDAFLMYARKGRSLVALFDPVGRPESWPELLQAFRGLAAQRGCRIAFYQASDRFRCFAAAMGMVGYKLGELAMIDLQAFSMAGKDWASLRRAVNRAERDGLSFSVIDKADLSPEIDALEQISQEWLAFSKAGEKRFSLGAFDRAYVASFPVAAVRSQGCIVAFATLLGAGDTVFVDLMRFRPGVHRGVMDLLMVRLIEHLKAQGIRQLNLGMAPLSGLEEDPGLWGHLARLLFERANSLYNFKGLRAFKAKFDPDWQPRYLLVEMGETPYRAAMAAMLLIAGGIGKVFR